MLSGNIMLSGNGGTVTTHDAECPLSVTTVIIAVPAILAKIDPFCSTDTIDGLSLDQVTEDIVGPYELHDFFIYNTLRYAFRPAKVYALAQIAFEGSYDSETIKRWLKIFYRRFFTQQFKRSCMPDGPAIDEVSLSPRGGWSMPSDSYSSIFSL